MARILVVGGAGGVGSALVDMLVKRGDRVTATVLNEAEAARVRGRHAATVGVSVVDFSDSDRALERLRALVASLDGLDAVAVCAAISPYGPVETMPLAVFRQAFEINCVADVAIYQAVMPALRESRGRIVLISSMAGRAAMPFIGAYVASKFALEGVADVMRREAAAHGVHISIVEPGGIRTGMVEEQLRTIKGRIASLDLGEEQLYGHLYRQFEKLAGESHNMTASSPEQVAGVLLEALDAAEPETRYIAGDDARELIGLVDSVSDRELDTEFARMFGGAVSAFSTRSS